MEFRTAPQRAALPFRVLRYSRRYICSAGSLTETCAMSVLGIVLALSPIHLRRLSSQSALHYGCAAAAPD